VVQHYNVPQDAENSTISSAYSSFSRNYQPLITSEQLYKIVILIEDIPLYCSSACVCVCVCVCVCARASARACKMCCSLWLSHKLQHSTRWDSQLCLKSTTSMGK